MISKLLDKIFNRRVVSSEGLPIQRSSVYEDKRRIYQVLLVIAALSICVRILVEYRFDHSALLYVGIPFLVALFLIKVRNPADPSSWKKKYLNRLIDAFIIMLASSIVLFEGFVCVVMFIPIYLFILLAMFISDAIHRSIKSEDKNSLKAHIIPLFILLSAFEGINPSLSFNRVEQVSASRVVNLNIKKIRGNMEKPFELDKSRFWLLKLFPMPYEINAGSIKQGAVHEIRFEYYRWFFANRHEGRMLLEMTEVENSRIKTTFIENTSYIANYVNLKGTQIDFVPLSDDKTQITLTINYERKLDPYWYFGPIQRYSISKMADFLITEIMSNDG